jgi:small conductance mechanosensitive channel
MEFTVPPGLLQDIAVTLVKVAVIALVAWLLLRLVGRVVERIVLARLNATESSQHARTAADEEARKRLTTITSLVDWVLRVLILSFAGAAILIVLDLQAVIVLIAAMLAIVGVVARDVIRDYVGGFLVILENQYAIGDQVRIGADAGEVEALSLRRTLLRTAAGDRVTIPNGDIRVLTNRTSTWGRINLDIGIAEASKLDAARSTIDATGQAFADDPAYSTAVLETPHLVSISDIGDRGIRLTIQGRIEARGRFDTEAAFRERLLRALGEAGIDVVTATRMHVIDVRPSAAPSGDGSRDGEPAAETPRA